ncbi:MAG: NAD-dependent epimerase/dehydratase family protein, partial [Vicinamibacterales bacterium]|nr:NAD-dependent epimerase/dehydratase family protein [Vicinamibacterales bacterium]
MILDLQLEPRGLALVERILAVTAEQARLPILVFSGSVTSTDEVRRLSTLGIAGYVNEHCAAQQILPALAPHLFPDSFNRRSSARVTLAIPIAYRVGDSLNSATTLGLSKGGVAIRTMTPLDLFSQVEVRFRLPGVKREIEAAARVTWTDARVGMGLQFERIDATDQAAVDAFFDAEDIEFVFLAAAKVGGIHANNTERAEFIYDNLVIETNVIDAAYRQGASKLLFLGSSCIYPKFADQPIAEESLLTGALEPTNQAYAIAKIAGITMCQSYASQYGFNAISLM